MSAVSNRLGGLVVLSILLVSSPVWAADALTPPSIEPSTQPVKLTAAQDHARLMRLLGLKSIPPGASGQNANSDESKANPYPDLPDPLTLKNGQKVTTPQMWWQQRRPEIYEDFQSEIYGRTPQVTPKVTWEVTSTTNNGTIITKQLVGHVDNSAYPQISVNIQATLCTPCNAIGPVPVMMQFSGGGFGAFGRGRIGPGTRSGREGPLTRGSFPGIANAGPTWQQQVLARGWGYATINTASVQADNGAGLTSGIIGLVNKGQPRALDDWGVLSAWAWGASRVLDYFQTDKLVDAKQVGLEGHSRWGKATLVAMAFDQRFAIAYVSSSGEGGAKLHRRNWGELVENIAGTGEYHWMAGNFLKYAGHWDKLPVDSHELIALCAPRPVLITGGITKGDGWVDARGMFMAAAAAGPVYRLLGKKDLGTTEMPPVDTALIDGDIAFRQHNGGHTDALDWPTFLIFASRYIHGPRVGLLPAPGAKDVCIDTPLRLTVADGATIKSGAVTVVDAANDAIVATVDLSGKPAVRNIGGLSNFNYYPAVVSGNEVTVYLPEHALDYGKTYFVKVDSDGFKADDEQTWRFSTRPAPPGASARLTVAADGSGDFATVQGAVDSIAEGNITPVTIFIRNGVYHEIICLLNKNNVTLLGEDRQKTVIEYANNELFNGNAGGNPFGPNSGPPGDADAKRGEPIYRRGLLLGHHCNDLVIANLTLHNTTPHGGKQAEAIILNGTSDAHAVLYDVDLSSFQDTLQINGQAYLKDCSIAGDVDFMWGTGPVFFEDCHLTAVHANAFYTQIRNPAGNHGFVYKDCTFDGTPGIAGSFLSRVQSARFPFSEVVLIDCVMSGAVDPVAWRLDQTVAPQVHYWEYNSHGADGKPVDVSRRLAISRQLKLPEDKEIIANYGDARYVLGGTWTPELPAIAAR